MSQRDVGMAPAHARNRQVAVLPAIALRCTSAQVTSLPSLEQEGLDAEAALGDFDRAVFAEQALLAAAVDADDRPVGLLAGEAAREAAARRLLGQGLDEIVGRGGERERPRRRSRRARSSLPARPRAADADSAPPTPAAQADRGRRRRRARVAHVAPVATVVGQLRRVARRGLAVAPAQRQPAELARRARGRA